MRHRRTPLRALMLAFAALVITARPAPLAGQAAQTEGYDPLRQITAQLIKANLLIVQDVSGSMAWDKYGNSVGIDSHGELAWESTLDQVRSASTTASTGTVQFTGKDVSGGQTRTVSDTAFSGAGSPGVFTVSYASNGPTFTCTGGVSGCTNSTRTVRATQLPVLLYNSSAGRWEPAYRCKPIGSWQQSDLVVPWASSTKVYENTKFDFTQCTSWSSGLYFTYPSRMMNVKNALGNSVYIADEYEPPNPTLTGKDKWKDADWGEMAPYITRGSTPAGTVLIVDEAYKLMKGNTKSWRFKVEAGYELASGGTYNPSPAGSLPQNLATKVNWVKGGTELFPAYHTSAPASYLDSNGNPVRSPGLNSSGGALPAGNWAIGWTKDPAKYGAMTIRAPNDVIGRNRERINFGLATFSGDAVATYPYLFPIDTYDTNNVDRLEGHFAARVDPDGNNVYSYVPKMQLPIKTDSANMERVQIGLNGSGSTPTKFALTFAKSIVERTFEGGTLKASNKTWTLPEDPKKECLRTYGVILVTDGLSNQGNPSDGNWMKPCDTIAGRNDCDGGSSGYDCPKNWAVFAANSADEIYNLNLTQSSGSIIRPRVWAIGISSAVGPCELDFIAYMGRTDANSPSGDAGFGGYDVKNNPRLPDPKVPVDANPVDTAAGTYDGPTGNRYWAKKTTQTYRAPDDPVQSWWPTPAPTVTGKGHNAFFANDAAALGEAFAAIVNATATGDYATNAPVSGMSAAAKDSVYLPSTGFPNWKGHLYSFNIKKKEGEDGYRAWDAGEKLAARAASLRKIFTWDPSTNDLVEVTQANLAKAPLKDVAGLTAAVVDFIRGNDGTLSDKLRSWPLGPMINSAPAIVASPGSWTQNTVVDHKSFQLSTGSRDPLLWVGSNDGMLHAFRSTDGIEQIAILPPNLLSTQVTLYNNYVEDPTYPSGQPPDILEHIYGVANSFRFGDVYFSGEGYKTIGIVTFGAGATDLFAMDVTRIPKPDDASYPSDPVKILWTKTSGGSSTSTTLEKLAQTFSIPAMAPVTSNTWRLVGASGFNPGNTRTTQGTASFVAPRTYVLDPTDGSIVETKSLTSLSTPAPFVGNQAFADSVLFDPKAKAYQEDNVARLGLQADLNGQIWFLYASNQYANTDFDTAKVGIDVSNDVSPAQSQPIYYNPAASGVGADLQGCVAYAFGSGTLYERSSLITGAGIGTAPNFVPRIYVATGKKASFTDKLTTDNIKARVISSSWTVTRADNTTYTTTFGKRTQLTAPPFLLVPKSGTGANTALFLLYDPDIGCNGFSYVVVVDFEGDSSCEPGTPTFKAYEAGVGAASGFTIAGDKVLVSKSGIGEGQQAGLYQPPNITAFTGGNPTPKVRWWKELK